MDNSLFLRRVFTLDAATCFGFFALLTFGAATLAPLTGLDTGLLRGAGLYLLPCAALFLWLGTRPQPPVALSVIGILGNIAWVAKSIAVLAIFKAELTLFGNAFVAAQGAGVLGLVLLETVGLRRMRAAV